MTGRKSRTFVRVDTYIGCSPAKSRDTFSKTSFWFFDRTDNAICSCPLLDSSSLENSGKCKLVPVLTRFLVSRVPYPIIGFVSKSKQQNIGKKHDISV